MSVRQKLGMILEIKWFHKPSGNQVNLKVIPKTGMILLHDHMIDHGVPELKKGVKYVIRTDVMCKLET